MMANDKSKITCKDCGESMAFGKHDPTVGHHILPEDVSLLVDFAHKHMKCSPDYDWMDVNVGRRFELSAESDKTVVDKQ